MAFTNNIKRGLIKIAYQPQVQAVRFYSFEIVKELIALLKKSHIAKAVCVAVVIAIVGIGYALPNKPMPLSQNMTLEQLPHTLYDKKLPYAVKKVAEKYKQEYVDNKLEDVVAENAEKVAWQRKWLALEFEQAINLLYKGDVAEPKVLQAMLNLIKYGTNMFNQPLCVNLLKQRSQPLADFVIDYQIEKAMQKQ